MVKLERQKIFGVFIIFTMAYILIYTGTRCKDSSMLISRNMETTTESSLRCALDSQGTRTSNGTDQQQKNVSLIEHSSKPRDDTMSHTSETDRLRHVLHQRVYINDKNIKTVSLKHKRFSLRGTAPPLPGNVTVTENNVVYVLLLAYQRSGSSFTGNLLNRNPSVFYVYEPLDALYSSLYGIPPGWSVPSDITGNRDGSLRQLPEYEVHAAADVISNLLECHFDRLPKEVLLSQFWTQFWLNQINLLDFTKCMASAGVYVAKCQRLHLRRICSQRLGQDWQKDERCHKLLHLQSDSSSVAAKAKYSQCLLSETVRAKKCFPLLEKRCRLSPVRGVKTVRATMEVAQLLLSRHQNLKVIHLIRDPRPVLLSRMQHESYRASASQKSMISEARFYCNIVDHDIEIRKQLDLKYKAHITELIYERFTADPLNETEKVYKFLQIPLARDVNHWVVSDTKKSLKIAHAWQSKMKKSDQVQIDEICKDLLLYGKKIW